MWGVGSQGLAHSGHMDSIPHAQPRVHRPGAGRVEPGLFWGKVALTHPPRARPLAHLPWQTWRASWPGIHHSGSQRGLSAAQERGFTRPPPKVMGEAGCVPPWAWCHSPAGCKHSPGRQRGWQWRDRQGPTDTQPQPDETLVGERATLAQGSQPTLPLQVR